MGNWGDAWRIFGKRVRNSDSPANNDVVTYDSALDQYVNSPGGSGAVALTDLTDVTITAAASGEYLRKGAGDWVNSDLLLADLKNSGGSAGDLAYWNGTNWVKLAIGSANQKLVVNSGATAPEWVNDVLIKSKSADEIVNNSAVLQNDDDFFFTVVANGKYIVEMFCRINIKTTSDFKYLFVLPSGTARGIAFDQDSYAYQTGANIIADVDITAARTILQGIDATGMWVPIMGLIEIGVTGGTVNFQWAQNTATVEDTIIKAGSMMRVTRTV